MDSSFKESLQTLTTETKTQLYSSFVKPYIIPFVGIMNLFYGKILGLQKHGKLSEFVQFRTRIKDIQSAINNDNEKSLDDIFGFELLGATDHEANTGAAAHTTYKKLDMQKIQEDYNNGNFRLGYNVPYMFSSFPSQPMRLLTLNEALQKKFPELDVSNPSNNLSRNE